MVNLRLKHIHKVRSKGDVYIYAWRGKGAPRLHSKPGTPEFVAELDQAWQQRYRPDDKTVAALIVEYRASDEFERLADSTKTQWLRWLDRIRAEFGPLSVKQFERDIIRKEILEWRSKMKKPPRQQDYAIQVFSRLMSFAVERGKLSRNPIIGIKPLYKANRADKVWSEEHLEKFLAVASEEVGYAVRLALLTGLRKGDLLRLSWNHIHDSYIELSTSKSRGRQTATIPITAELRVLLEKIPKRSTTVLTNSKKKPWTGDGLGSSFWKTRVDAGLKDVDLNFHDLRGTAATRFYLAGLNLREIAEIMGWSEKRVEDIIKRYVTKGAMIQEKIRKLEAHQKEAG